MFFLIRCIFWLTIVYSSLFSSSVFPTGNGARPAQVLRDAVIQGGAAVVGAAKGVAVREAMAWCVKSQDQCLADAARLTALIVASQAEEAGDDAVDPASLAVTYPTPPSAPRRRDARRS